LNRNRLQRFFRLLGEPIKWRSRFFVGFLSVPLVLCFTAPLWKLQMAAPQYPEGLELVIYAHTIEGDVQEINTLNHYIGMERIDRAMLRDLDWIPFALGALVLLTLRVASIGSLRSLIDLLVLFLYFSGFSMARFYYQLYNAGHNLDPHAPFSVEPFMPPVIGTKQIANFTVTSMPAGATFWISIFALGLLVALVWNVRMLPRRPSWIRHWATQPALVSSSKEVESA
jgi:hypothetical protein